ncbi:dihydrodipicolinate synthase family protein [Roseomonas sp. HF4]|uniref:dihydrodipicolinate synthase family protein n=1 Tax=Roseomonas sp. HF4 TaxID=2562313 RepID=UPI0010C0D9A1|nr:dihydrodipicolinate synthase family protein [Roseomonas sp. HF4]
MRYAPGEARDWVRAELSGYVTILYTPFHADGSIDEAALRRNVRRTMALPGVGGLSVHSLHQEFFALTLAERKRVAELVLDEAAGRLPVVVGCSDPVAANVVDLLRHATAAGADLAMVWPPFYGPRDAAGVRAFYEHVAERSAIGMVVYSTTLAELGYYLAPEQVEALLHLPNVCAVQDTTLNFASYARMMERVGDRIAVSTSLEEYFLFGRLTFPERAPRFMIGSSRPVLCQTAAVPHCGRFLDAALRDDFSVAARHLRDISAIAGRLQSRYFAQGFHHVALFKTLAGVLGMEVGAGWRPALAPPDPRDVAECVAVLRAAGLLDGAA